MNKEDDLKWDSRELGADERYVASSSCEVEKEVDEILNLISVRFKMNKELHSLLCKKAEREGFNISAYIRRLIESDVK